MSTHLLERIDLINILKPDAKPAWGKMTPQHMVEHLTAAFKMSIGELNVECITPPEKIPVLKRVLLSSRPLPKNFVNPVIGPDLIPLNFPSLNEAISELRKTVERYYKYYELNPEAAFTNPTFGLLDKDEWLVFHNKHTAHHLNQFSLLDK